MIERPPRAAPSAIECLEQRLGTQVATWLGALLLLGAAGFYFRLAVTRGLLGPWAKLGCALAVGVAAVALGDRFLRTHARLLGQAVAGVGVALVFGAAYAGFARYGVYDARVGAAVMVVATALGLGLAVRRDAAILATLAALGAYLTPALASSGGGGRDALFAYLLVLDLGVLVVAARRRWRGLEAVASLGTWGLFAAWYHVTAAPGVGITLAWCLGFGAVFVGVPLAFHLRHQLALSTGRLAAAVAAGAVTFGFGCEILDGVGPHLAGLALALAAAYAALVAVVRRRLPGDGLAHAVMASAAVVCAALAVPLAVRDRGLVVGWAIAAPVLLGLGAHYRLAVVRYLGALVAALAIGRLVTAHWSYALEGARPFASAACASASIVVAAVAAYAWLGRRVAARLDDALGAALARGAAIAAIGLAALTLDRELRVLGFGLGGDHAARQLAVAAWLATCAGALAVGRARAAAAWLAVATWAVAAVLAFGVALATPAGALFVNPGFGLPALAALLGLVIAARAIVGGVGGGGDQVGRDLGLVIGLGAGAALWVLVTREAWVHPRLGVEDLLRARWLGHATVTCAWSALAAATLGVGFARRWPPVRVLALGLFGLTAAKVLLVDLARVGQAYRVLSLVVVGALLLVTSWLYHRRART
jgi:uncharacterized membrane protein